MAPKRLPTELFFEIVPCVPIEEAIPKNVLSSCRLLHNLLHQRVIKWLEMSERISELKEELTLTRAELALYRAELASTQKNIDEFCQYIKGKLIADAESVKDTAEKLKDTAESLEDRAHLIGMYGLQTSLGTHPPSSAPIQHAVPLPPPMPVQYSTVRSSGTRTNLGVPVSPPRDHCNVVRTLNPSSRVELPRRFTKMFSAALKPFSGLTTKNVPQNPKSRAEEAKVKSVGFGVDFSVADCERISQNYGHQTHTLSNTEGGRDLSGGNSKSEKSDVSNDNFSFTVLQGRKLNLTLLRASEYVQQRKPTPAVVTKEANEAETPAQEKSAAHNQSKIERQKSDSFIESLQFFRGIEGEKKPIKGDEQKHTAPSADNHNA